MNQETPKAPKLRFKDENGNNFPDWRETKLGNFGNIRTSSVDKKINNGDPYVKLVNYMDVYKRDRLFLKDNFQVVTAKQSQLQSSDLKKGDILFTPSSETPEDIGHSAVVMEDLPNTVFSYHLVRFRQNQSLLTSEYSSYAFKSHNFYNKARKLAQGATRFTLSINSLEEIRVIFPQSKFEQEKIAIFFNNIDKYIENLKSQKEKLEKYKKGMMQKIFSQQIRFKDENGKDFPDWKGFKLKELIEVLTDYTANGSFASLRENAKYYNTEEYAVLVRSTDLNKEDFIPERYTDKKGYEFLKKTSLKEGDLILANVGNIGEVFKVPAYHKPMTLAPNTYLIKFNTSVIKEFIFQIMLTSEFKNKVESLTVSNGFRAINKSTFSSIIIKIPNVKEQSKISDYLFLIDRVIKEQNNKINLLIKWKKGLIQKMFI